MHASPYASIAIGYWYCDLRRAACVLARYLRNTMRSVGNPRIAPRSGLAVKNGIHVGAGVVDPDYRGEVKVLLMNMSDVDFHAAAGTRVAQMILERCATPPVLAVDTLDDTARGDAGFGSTGR